MIGDNVLAQSVGSRDALVSVLKQKQPALVVVMDDMPFAVRLRDSLPAATMVHRSYHPSDAEFHLKWTPQQFIETYCVNIPAGIVIQCLNEPSGYSSLPELASWCSQVMAMAAARGVKLALPNFAVGHPQEDLTPLDPLFKAFKGTPHIYATHEYFQSHPDHEPYHVGRVNAVISRFKQLGIQPPTVMITEAGRDVGGGERDGWRDTGWSESEYAAKVQQQAEVYSRMGIQAMAVFCYGSGADHRWQSFNTERADGYHQLISEYNRSHPSGGGVSMIWDYGDAVKDATAKTPGAVNIRTQADTSSAVIGTLEDGDKVTYWENKSPEANDGHFWWKIHQDDRDGFVAATFVTFTDPLPPTLPPPDDMLYIPFGAAEIQQLATLHSQIANIYQNALRRA